MWVKVLPTGSVGTPALGSSHFSLVGSHEQRQFPSVFVYVGDRVLRELTDLYLLER